MRIGRTLRLVREAIRVFEADAEMFREPVERVQKANGSQLAIPRYTPDVILRRIERVRERPRASGGVAAGASQCSLQTAQTR